jgi:hypothetical protein
VVVRVDKVVVAINRSEAPVRVTLTIDPTDSRDIAMYSEARGWLHPRTRSSWTVSETEIGNEGRTALTFNFDDPLDASDFRYWRGLRGRGRLL